MRGRAKVRRPRRCLSLLWVFFGGKRVERWAIVEKSTHIRFIMEDMMMNNCFLWSIWPISSGQGRLCGGEWGRSVALKLSPKALGAVFLDDSFTHSARSPAREQEELDKQLANSSRSQCSESQHFVHIERDQERHWHDARFFFLFLLPFESFNYAFFHPPLRLPLTHPHPTPRRASKKIVVSLYSFCSLLASPSTLSSSSSDLHCLETESSEFRALS